MRNLKCAIQMMVQTIIWIAHFKLRIAMWFGILTVQNTVIRIIIWIAHFKLCIAMWFGIHTVQTTVFRILIQNVHFDLKFKLRTLLSCENSLCLLFSIIPFCIRMLKNKHERASNTLELPGPLSGPRTAVVRDFGLRTWMCTCAHNLLPSPNENPGSAHVNCHFKLL